MGSTAPTAPSVELVCGGADFLPSSHRNMERAGMRLSFPRAIWTPLEPWPRQFRPATLGGATTTSADRY